MYLEAAPSTRQHGIACPHCRAFNQQRHLARVPVHVYAEQGFIVDSGVDAHDDPAAPDLNFTPFRCVDPVCATLWLRACRDGEFFGWVLGS